MASQYSLSPRGDIRQASRIYLSFASINFGLSGSFVADVFTMEEAMERRRRECYLAGLETAKGILQSGIEQIKRKGVENVYEGRDTPAESSEILRSSLSLILACARLSGASL